MSTPILVTKLHIPAPRPTLVPRPHLLERLSHALHNKLTLIAAPPGFGKTTLVSHWLHQKAEGRKQDDESNKKSTHHSQAAWLSVDEGDNDPARFFSYVIAALQKIEPDIGQAAQHLLNSAQSFSTEAVMTALVNDIAAQPAEFVLILDDYHTIESPTIQQAVTFLLENQPEQLHLLITSRAEPPLPLSRLRARGQLLELGLDALKFTLEETDHFLNQVMGLNLPAQDVTRLHTLTEGWATGLQLAALALQANPHQPAARFITNFSGTDRYIGEYLFEEIFQQQAEKRREFLLHTSILTQLSGDLCDHLTGQSNGRQTLVELDKANLFMTPLDNEGQWYRYHPLFASFLRSHLHQIDPNLEIDLHCRAAAWYVAQGLKNQAIDHALAANDFDRAADLVETMMAEKLWLQGEMFTPLNWLDALPVDYISTRPRLMLGQAWAMLMVGRNRDELSPILQQLEASLNNASSTASPASEADQIRGEMATVLAEASLLENKLSQALTLAHQALTYLPEDDRASRYMATQIQGYVYRLTGQVEQAMQALTKAAEGSRRAENILVAAFALSDLGEVQAMQGQLRQASQTYQQTFELAAEHNAWPFAPTCAAYVGLGNLWYEWNDLARAAQHLHKAIDLSKQGGYASVTLRAYLALAHVRQAQENHDKAMALLNQAQRLAQKHPSDRMKSYLTVARLRLWLLAGKDYLAQAIHWADNYVRETPESTPFIYLRHLEQTALARIQLAQNKPNRALLADLLQQAESAGWGQNVIEILILQALAAHTLNDSPGAMAALNRALVLAEPENYIRLFVDEGAPMVRLLQKAVGHGVPAEYVGRLQASFMPSVKDEASEAQPLLEPLTKRELEVLGLMAAGLSNRQIADELVIAMGTVAKYSNNIFSKLAVSNRTQAINLAQSLNLI